MNDRVITATLEGKPAALPEAFMIRVPYRLGLMLLALVLGTIWGLEYATAKMVSHASIDPLTALFAVHLVLAILMVAALVGSGRTFPLDGKTVAYFAGVALVYSIVPLGAELAAAHHLSAGELALVLSLTPACILIFAFLFRSERVTRLKLIGIGTGCLAAAAMVLPATLSGTRSDPFWFAIAFAGPLAAGAGCVMMAKFWPRNLDCLQVATGNLTAGAILLMPVLLFRGEFGGVQASHLEGWWAVAGFGFTVGTSYYLLAVITRLSGAAFTGCSDFIAICTGLGWGYLFFAEIPTVWMVAAAGLCLVSLKLTADGVISAESKLA